jgi:putative flippase GtrA
MSVSRALFLSLLRYAIVGILNSLVGLAIILGLQFGLGAPPHIANAVGYSVGIGLGFMLNRRFVFENNETVWRTGPRYCLAALIAFLANQLVLTLAIDGLGSEVLALTFAQVLGVTCYTIAFFLLCRLWVFVPVAALG